MPSNITTVAAPNGFQLSREVAYKEFLRPLASAALQHWMFSANSLP